MTKSSKEKLNLKQWDEQDRPREKLRTKGPAALSDAELLAILLRVGNRDESAVDLAKKILRYADNNLIELGRLQIDQYIKCFKGVGEAKAISIIAALELGKRRNAAEPYLREKISSSQQVFQIMHPILECLPHEEFWVLLLNRGNKVMKKFKLSHGTTTGTLVDVKIILKEAIANLATGIILCHNHPSDNCTPSQSDIHTTRKVSEAANLMDIRVLDHLIICSKSYYSMLDEGVL